jgi:transposase
MISQEELDKIKNRYETMKPFLQNEQQRRMYAVSEVRALNQYGAVSAVSRIMDISRTTITDGLKQVEEGKMMTGRVRKAGGGRKKLETIDESLQSDLMSLMDDSACGDPCNPLKWTCRSLHNIEEALQEKGHQISHTKVHQMLVEQGYSMQGNQKALEGNSQHPDRNEQFEIINQKAKAFMEMDIPVISVDAKKKELIGNYRNNGKEHYLKGKAPRVNVHDFEDKELGKINPYGIYDIYQNEGMVNVGTDKDTAEFAVESIRRWWHQMGKNRYPNAGKIMITCDGGGSNGSRSRLWKYELQRLATEENLEIYVSHYPPGTSKWNKIEHSMFSYISKNWRGRPLVSHEVVVNLIASTKNKKGLSINCVMDTNKYQTGRKVSDMEMEMLNIGLDKRLPNWNYRISPM